MLEDCNSSTRTKTRKEDYEFLKTTNYHDLSVAALIILYWSAPTYSTKMDHKEIGVDVVNWMELLRIDRKSVV